MYENPRAAQAYWVYKRDVREISLHRETRILTKMIKLRHTGLVYMSLTSLFLCFFFSAFSQILSEGDMLILCICVSDFIGLGFERF